jgi:hypothetical protein
VIGRLLRGTPCVLSTGGGAFLSETNRSLIHDVGVSVWLCADLDLLWQRVRHKTTRPLLRTANPRETLRELYESAAAALCAGRYCRWMPRRLLGRGDGLAGGRGAEARPDVLESHDLNKVAVWTWAHAPTRCGSAAGLIARRGRDRALAARKRVAVVTDETVAARTWRR